MDFICKDIFADVANDCRDFKADTPEAFSKLMHESYGRAPIELDTEHKRFNETLDYMAATLDFCAGKESTLSKSDSKFFEALYDSSKEQRHLMNTMIMPMVSRDPQDRAALDDFSFVQEILHVAASTSWFRQNSAEPDASAAEACDTLHTFFNHQPTQFTEEIAGYPAYAQFRALEHADDCLTARTVQKRPTLARLLESEANRL